MTLHKMVNGQKVFLKPEEEEALRKEWLENARIADEERRQEKVKLETRSILKTKVSEKLGITVEELELLIGK